MINVYLTGTTFVPAVGVEIVVLTNFGVPTFYVGITNGVNTSYIYNQDYNNFSGQTGTMSKFGFTNTFHYYNSQGGSNQTGFSGIQIK